MSAALSVQPITKQKRIVIEAVPSDEFTGRWHYRALNTPDFFRLGPNHSRSLRTWATKRAAIRAGLREYPSATSQYGTMLP